MKKIEQPHSMANNGLEALEKYKESPSEYSCILTGKPSVKESSYIETLKLICHQIYLCPSWTA
jgi:hypothetical protein